MKLGLFIPCYIDAFFPEVGVATLELLERLGCSVEYPLDQTCCGQPMANSGCQEDSAATEAHFVYCFNEFDTVVGPSGSCVHHVRFHLDAIEQTPQARKVRAGTRELVEFLHDDLKVADFPWAPAFPHKVGLHDSCSAVRGLGHARPSERDNEPYFSKTRDLLGRVRGLELVDFDRPDECCGFGGSFCVTDEAVSAKMGYDRVYDFHRHGVEYTSHFHGPRHGGELHVVLVDNTRSDRLGSPDFWHALKCIRCGACMNTCPVYRRGGGLSYGATYSGPVGVILEPGFDLSKYREQPFHSSLCGSCTEVCPVKIDISDQIYKWRRVVAEKGMLKLSKKVGMSALGTTLAHPAGFHAAESAGESALERLPRFLLYNPLNPWGKHRELPKVPRQTFRQWYLENRRKS
jgi:L-lactate dehydrogenase complex protein LldE